MKKDKPAVSTSTKPRRKRWTSDDTELTLLGLPAAIWYAVFCYLPMFGLIIAFKNFKITPGRGFLYSLFHSDWAGFDNFKFFLTSNTFTMLLRNTLLYNILFIVLNIVIPVTLAVLINQIYSRIASKAYQTMMFFPYFLSWVVVSYFVYAFLNPDKGLMNTIIQFFGGDKIMWYSQPKWWPLILTFMQVWKSMGYNMSNTSEKILQKTRLIQKKLSSTPPLELFDESVFKELVKKVLISNTAIQFELINGMKLSESRAAT